MAAMPNHDRISLRHDLMIELGRTEMALDDICTRPAANQPELKQTLEIRRAKLTEALARIPA